VAPPPVAGAGAGDVWQVRLGSTSGATLEVSVEPEARAPAATM
jgi:hypothetical protein